MELVVSILEDEGYSCDVARDSDEFLRMLTIQAPKLVFVDIWLQGSRLDGLQVLSIVTEQWPSIPVVIISGHSNIETSVAAIKLGAYDFIEKPFKVDRLVLVADRALETARLRQEVTFEWAKQLELTCDGIEHAHLAYFRLLERMPRNKALTILESMRKALRSTVRRRKRLFRS